MPNLQSREGFATFMEKFGLGHTDKVQFSSFLAQIDRVHVVANLSLQVQTELQIALHDWGINPNSLNGKTPEDFQSALGEAIQETTGSSDPAAEYELEVLKKLYADLEIFFAGANYQRRKAARAPKNT